MKFLNSFSTGFWTLVGLCLFLAVLGFIIYRLSKQPDQQQIKQNGVIKSPNSNKQSLLTRLLLILNNFPIISMVVISNLMTVVLLYIIGKEQSESFFGLIRTPLFFSVVLMILSGWLERINNTKLFGRLAPNKIERFILRTQVYIIGCGIMIAELFFIYNPIYAHLRVRDQMKIQERTQILIDKNKEQQQTEEDGDGVVNVAKIRQQARSELVNEGLIVDSWFGYLSLKVMIHLVLVTALMFLISRLTKSKQFDFLLASIGFIKYETEKELLGGGNSIGFILRPSSRVEMLQTLSQLFSDGTFKLIQKDNEFVVLLNEECTIQLGISLGVLKQYVNNNTKGEYNDKAS